jgi:hypothetical protein
MVWVFVSKWCIKLEIRLIFGVIIHFFVCGSEFRARWGHENSYQIAIKSLFCTKCRIASYNTQKKRVIFKSFGPTNFQIYAIFLHVNIYSVFLWILSRTVPTICKFFSLICTASFRYTSSCIFFWRLQIVGKLWKSKFL